MRVLIPEQLSDPRSQAAAPVDVHAHYAAGWADRTGMRVNFISSADGGATAGGLSRGLQTPGDNAVFAALRDLADVIVVGAATAQAEGYRPASPSPERTQIRQRYGFQPAPAIAVLSSSLNLNLDSELYRRARPDAPTMIITGSAAPISARNDVIDLAGSDAAVQLLEAPADGNGGVDLAAAIRHLLDIGYRRILCEGGPRLFGSAVAAGVVTELCLSISPMLVGPGAPRIVAGEQWEGEQPTLTLAGLLSEDDALFCRYLVGSAVGKHP